MATAAKKTNGPGAQGLVVFAKSLRRVAAFYARTLQLDVAEQAATHQVLRGRGCEVLVHAIPRQYAAAIVIRRPPEPREDTPFKPTFVVADLEAVRAAAKATGGHLEPAAAAWDLGTAIVLDGWDPEGNVVQFRQPIARKRGAGRTRRAAAPRR